ncbi:hypothetical protein RFI_40353, partial [Reticulomyxa filosa]
QSEKRQQDIDPDTMPDLEKGKMRRFMEKHFNEIANSSPAHQRSFFKYLYQQFLPLVQSKFLKKKFLEADKKSMWWKHEITKSVIKVATISCCCQYNHIKLNEEKEQKIEGTGREEFYLCEKWHNSKDYYFLVNQDRESISVLISDIKNVNQRQLDEFKKLEFYLFEWQQDLRERELILQVLHIFELKIKESESQTEKEKRLRLLLRILGVPDQGTMKEYEEKKVETTESLHDQIVNKLCNDKEWSNYVLTFDNILKMIAVFMKIRTNTPVILMGETGCGKTSLIKFLGHVVNVQLIAVDVHAGFGRHEICEKMDDCNGRLSKDNETEIWIFLDEVNTSPDIGWFKELICDRRLDGVKINDQIKIIAACNPYRLRKAQTSDITNKNDPLSKWMYRVVPLCETMKEYVWPFGQLSELDEKQYIQAMTKQIKCKFDKNTVVYKKIQQWEFKIAEDIAASHCLLRKHLANEFIVSLRDVSRCLNFFHCDKKYSWAGRALNIALGLCYYLRLDERGRTMYNNLMHQRSNRPFSELLDTEIRNLSRSFEIPARVALHKNLKENLFILFFCVATSTPMILIGKPGTSKTLSLQILLDTLSHRNIKQFRQKLKDNKFHFN